MEMPYKLPDPRTLTKSEMLDLLLREEYGRLT